jgi:hypothetical protein
MMGSLRSEQRDSIGDIGEETSDTMGSHEARQLRQIRAESTDLSRNVARLMSHVVSVIACCVLHVV